MNRLLTALQPYLDSLSEQWATLETNQRKVATVVLISLAVLIPVGVVCVPLASARGKAETQLASQERNLTQILELEKRVRAAGLQENGDKKAKTKKRRKKQSLLNKVNRVTDKLDISSLVESVRPVQRGRGRGDQDANVEVKLKGLVLEEMVNFLYQLEVVQNLKVSRLEVQKNSRTPEKLEASLEVGVQ